MGWFFRKRKREDYEKQKSHGIKETICSANDNSAAESQNNSLDRTTLIDGWREWPERLRSMKADPHYDDRIRLYFLDKKMWVAPDGYSGEDKICYYSKKRGCFYTLIDHWDGGNFRAGFTRHETLLSAEDLQALFTESKKRHMQKFDGPEQDEFLEVYNSIEQVLMEWVNSPG